MSTPIPIRFALAGLAAVAVALGGYAIGSSNDGTSTGANASQATPPASASQGSPSTASDDVHGPPAGFGTPATGAVAKKAEAAALTKYDGTVERVMKLEDGSYEVHVITANGEYHVAVSKAFKVTGTSQGGPGGGNRDAAPQSGSSDGATS